MRISGPKAAQLANSVSEAIKQAVEEGLDTDLAACVVVQVAADYARVEYGTSFLIDLANIVQERGRMPLPSGMRKRGN